MSIRGRVKKTEGGSEAFDQSQASAIELLQKTKDSFAVFVINEEGRMVAEVSMDGTKSKAWVSGFVDNAISALQMIKEDW